MCKHAFEKFSKKTDKIMLFCKILSDDTDMPELCICQKFCTEKNRYVEFEQDKNCKKYECE